MLSSFQVVKNIVFNLWKLTKNYDMTKGQRQVSKGLFCVNLFALKRVKITIMIYLCVLLWNVYVFWLNNINQAQQLKCLVTKKSLKSEQCEQVTFKLCSEKIRQSNPQNNPNLYATRLARAEFHSVKFTCVDGSGFKYHLTACFSCRESDRLHAYKCNCKLWKMLSFTSTGFFSLL